MTDIFSSYSKLIVVYFSALLLVSLGCQQENRLLESPPNLEDQREAWQWVGIYEEALDSLLFESNQSFENLNTAFLSKFLEKEISSLPAQPKPEWILESLPRIMGSGVMPLSESHKPSVSKNAFQQRQKLKAEVQEKRRGLSLTQRIGWIETYNDLQVSKKREAYRKESVVFLRILLLAQMLPEVKFSNLPPMGMSMLKRLEKFEAYLGISPPEDEDHLEGEEHSDPARHEQEHREAELRLLARLRVVEQKADEIYQKGVEKWRRESSLLYRATHSVVFSRKIDGGYVRYVNRDSKIYELHFDFKGVLQQEVESQKYQAMYIPMASNFLNQIQVEGQARALNSPQSLRLLVVSHCYEIDDKDDSLVRTNSHSLDRIALHLGFFDLTIPNSPLEYGWTIDVDLAPFEESREVISKKGVFLMDSQTLEKVGTIDLEIFPFWDGTISHFIKVQSLDFISDEVILKKYHQFTGEE